MFRARATGDTIQPLEECYISLAILLYVTRANWYRTVSERQFVLLFLLRRFGESVLARQMRFLPKWMRTSGDFRCLAQSLRYTMESVELCAFFSQFPGEMGCGARPQCAIYFYFHAQHALLFLSKRADITYGSIKKGHLAREKEACWPWLLRRPRRFVSL